MKNTPQTSPHSRSGFTLVEVVVASSIMVVIAVGALSIFFVLQNTWFAATLTMNSSTKVSNALNAIVYGAGSTNFGIRAADGGEVAVTQVAGGGWEFYLRGTGSTEFVEFDPVSGLITNETGFVFCDNVVTSTATLAGGGCEISITGREIGGRQQANTPWAQRETLAQNPANPAGMYLEGMTYVEIVGSNMVINNSYEGLTDHVVPIQPEQLLYVGNAPSASSTSERGYVTMEGGTLDGQMIIFAENDIYINTHLTYANDPRDDASTGVVSDDALGLVSKDDVWIASGAPNNLEVFAAIMATGNSSAANDGKFGVINYSSKPPAGDLTIYGSVVQQVRGAVATSNGSGMVSGYSKDYWWDTRFDTSAPPHYPPLDERIEISGWSESPAY